MKTHKRQYLSDYLASLRAIMKQVKGMWSFRVVRKCNWQITAQRPD